MVPSPRFSVQPFRLSDRTTQPRQFPTGRPALLAFVKDDCPTCRLVLPLIGQMVAALPGVDVLLIAQDDVRGVPPAVTVLDDSALAVSFRFGIEIVPTLIAADGDGTPLTSAEGFSLDEWRALVNQLVRLTPSSGPAIGWEGFPALRPGCGSKSVEPGIVERLAADGTGTGLRARRLELGPDDDDVEFLFERGFTDGLPVVPPTPERVRWMLDGTRRQPQEVVAVVPPNLAPATVEKVAINAVMAGCRPEYLPVVLAALEAACTDAFNVHGVMATTMGAAPVIVVNGPVRHRIGMNAGVSALGQGNRPNATIGRALRLVLRNLGGARPGGTERSTLGTPMKYTLCFAEGEEVSPWEPLHVERGFARDESVVTLFALTGGPLPIVDQASRTARALAGSLGEGLLANRHPRSVGSESLLVIAPEHAATLGGEGWSKADLRRQIVKVTTRPRRLLTATEDVGAGLAPDPAADPEAPVAKFTTADDLHIVVAGGAAGKYSAMLTGWMGGSGGSTPVSRRIEDVP